MKHLGKFQLQVSSLQIYCVMCGEVYFILYFTLTKSSQSLDSVYIIIQAASLTQWR